jgi:hypothetical protein
MTSVKPCSGGRVRRSPRRHWRSGRGSYWVVQQGNPTRKWLARRACGRKRWVSGAAGSCGIAWAGSTTVPAVVGRTITDEQFEAVPVATLERTPADAPHRSRASMAKESGLSKSTVGRVWKAFGLKPHLVDTFKISNDPQLIDKVRDVVGCIWTRRTRRWCSVSMRWVGLGRVDAFTSVTFPRPALRTGHACLHASRSPRVAVGTTRPRLVEVSEGRFRYSVAEVGAPVPQHQVELAQQGGQRRMR